MLQEKRHRKKKHHKGGTNENDERKERPRSRLFTEVDAQAAEMSNYMADYRVPLADTVRQERLIPTGVVDIDESVKFPSLPAKSPQHTHYDSKSHAALQSSENHHTEYVHLPPISQHHYPYEYYQPSIHNPHPEHSSYPYPAYYEPYIPHHSHQHQHHHHHHKHHHRKHHHRHHHHEREIVTYDPRWWYMPIGSVHRPISKQPIEYHYVAPKWYESASSRQSRISFMSPEPKSSVQKYVDCRCEQCRPSKAIPYGTRWIVNK